MIAKGSEQDPGLSRNLQDKEWTGDTYSCRCEKRCEKANDNAQDHGVVSACFSLFIKLGLF